MKKTDFSEKYSKVIRLKKWPIEYICKKPNFSKKSEASMMKKIFLIEDSKNFSRGTSPK